MDESARARIRGDSGLSTEALRVTLDGTRPLHRLASRTDGVYTVGVQLLHPNTDGRLSTVPMRASSVESVYRGDSDCSLRMLARAARGIVSRLDFVNGSRLCAELRTFSTRLR